MPAIRPLQCERVKLPKSGRARQHPDAAVALPPIDRRDSCAISGGWCGAGGGDRTPDINLGKVALYR
jgi:hypothetical protein